MLEEILYKVVDKKENTKYNIANKNNNFLVMMTWRKYLYPYRTQKSSSNVPKILASYLAGKIGYR